MITQNYTTDVVLVDKLILCLVVAPHQIKLSNQIRSQMSLFLKADRHVHMRRTSQNLNSTFTSRPVHLYSVGNLDN
jgi:hypothetical protein